MSRAEGPRHLIRTYLPRIGVVAVLGLAACSPDNQPATPTTTGFPESSTIFVPTSEFSPPLTTLPPASTTAPTVPPDEQREYETGRDAVLEGIAGRYQEAEKLVDTINNRVIHGVADDALDFTQAANAAWEAYVRGDFEEAQKLAEFVENPAIQRTLTRVIDAARQREALGKLNPTDPAWRQAVTVGADGLRELGSAAADTFRVLRERATGTPATTTSTPSG